MCFMAALEWYQIIGVRRRVPALQNSPLGQELFAREADPQEDKDRMDGRASMRYKILHRLFTSTESR